MHYFRDLTDISTLERYIHLRYVDITRNLLRSISALGTLTHMLVLRADLNKLTHIQLDSLPYLQLATFSANQLKTTEGLNHPLLEHLNLNCKYI